MVQGMKYSTKIKLNERRGEVITCKIEWIYGETSDRGGEIINWLIKLSCVDAQSSKGRREVVNRLVEFTRVTYFKKSESGGEVVNWLIEHV